MLTPRSANTPRNGWPPSGKSRVGDGGLFPVQHRRRSGVGGFAAPGKPCLSGCVVVSKAQRRSSEVWELPWRRFTRHSPMVAQLDSTPISTNALSGFSTIHISGILMISSPSSDGYNCLLACYSRCGCEHTCGLRLVNCWPVTNSEFLQPGRLEISKSCWTLNCDFVFTRWTC